MNNSENKFCRFLSDLMFCVVLLYTLMRQIRLFYLKMTKVEKFVKMCLHVKQSKSPFNFTIFLNKNFDNYNFKNSRFCHSVYFRTFSILDCSLVIIYQNQFPVLFRWSQFFLSEIIIISHIFIFCPRPNAFFDDGFFAWLQLDGTYFGHIYLLS